MFNFQILNGDPYFVKECLQYGTPVILTDFDVAREIVEDKKNGYIVDFELSNLDLNYINKNRLKKVEYKPKTTIEDWIKLIGKPNKKEKYNYEEIKKMKMKVKVIKEFVDLQNNGELAKIGDIKIMENERAEYIKSKGHIEIIEEVKEEVETVKEVKEVKKKSTTKK